MRPHLLLPIVLTAAACGRQVQVGGATGAPAKSVAITSPDQLVAAMHDRYAGKWYRSLTFIQKSTFLRPDGTPSRVETWYEAGALPGRLRIDLGEPARGNGVLYRGDSLYAIQAGAVADRRVSRNLLMVLGFDVYAQPVARTLEQLRAERIDLTLLHVDTLNGKRVYVVGAGPTDSTSNQFWVDADRMLFVRLIQTDERRRTQDIRFEKYIQHDGGWVAEEVRVLVGGRLVFHEEYANVRVNVPLDENLFVPEKWSAATHWYKP
jgi:hypothetical protein